MGTSGVTLWMPSVFISARSSFSFNDHSGIMYEVPGVSAFGVFLLWFYYGYLIDCIVGFGRQKIDPHFFFSLFINKCMQEYACM